MMGAMTEINSLVRFPGDFDFSSLKSVLEQKLYKSRFVEAGKFTGEAV